MNHRQVTLAALRMLGMISRFHGTTPTESNPIQDVLPNICRFLEVPFAYEANSLAMFVSYFFSNLHCIASHYPVETKKSSECKPRSLLLHKAAPKFNAPQYWCLLQSGACSTGSRMRPGCCTTLLSFPLQSRSPSLALITAIRSVLSLLVFFKFRL